MILGQRALLWLVSLAVVCSASPAYAWGIEGHQATAMLAEQQLSPTAKAAVSELLGHSMASVAVWADDVKDTSHQHTYNWHFVNIPSTADRYDPSRDCQPTPRARRYSHVGHEPVCLVRQDIISSRLGAGEHAVADGSRERPISHPVHSQHHRYPSPAR